MTMPKLYARELDGPLPKGTVCLDEAGWVSIIVEAERTKRYSPRNIINIAEVFGFEHESGSKYANEIVAIIETKDDFAKYLGLLGFNPGQVYWKGKLLLT